MVQKLGKAKQIMRDYGISGEGMPRFSAALKGAKQTLQRNLTEEELFILVSLYRKFLALDTRSVGNIPLSTTMGLGAVIARHMMTKQQIKLVSFASPAYDQDLEGRHVNITTGRDKRTYKILPQLSQEVSELGDLCTFAVFLSDIDPEVADKSSTEVEDLFEVNLKGLQVHFPSATRLSNFIGKTLIEQVKKQIVNNEKLVAAIEALQKRNSVLNAHRITEDALKDRALIYAALGKILEEKMPLLVVLDIQSRIYPYEQPFYDTLRKIPIPLLRPVKF